MILPEFRTILFLLTISLASRLQAADSSLTWHDVATLPIEGRGWQDTDQPYDRLPKAAATVVRKPVWELARHSAGLSVGFRTNATTISVRWKLTSERLAMSHMAATGVSGVDLYIRHGNTWKFLAVGRPESFPVCEKQVVRGLTPELKEFRLYFPLYNGVAQVEIGVPAESTLGPPDIPVSTQQIVFYGTSITQGGCASRPGMAYPAILGRRLDVATINLGFSGNGKAEPEMARLLAELNPSVFVLDPLANLETAQAVTRIPVLVQTLRERHPSTPILLVGNFPYPSTPFSETRRQKQQTSDEFLKSYYEAQVAAGDQHLHYLPADQLIGTDGEATVDALHPTDAGFLRMADVMEPVLRQILQASPAAAKP